MVKYIARRLILMIPTLLLVCFITFALMRIIPGSAVDTIIRNYADSGVTITRAEVEAMLGLDKPFFVQFFSWIGDLLRGDMGTAIFQTEDVTRILARELPVTLELTLFTFLIMTAVSIPLGLLCAARQDSLSDNSIRIVSVMLMSVPIFWLATLLLVYPAVWWGYSPPMKFVGFFRSPAANLKMFIAPALIAGLTIAGGQLRNVRTMTLEVMRQDFIRTAWSKGVKEKRILFVHAFRNAMIPVITLLGGSISMMMGGNVILENMFGIPGVGQQMIKALSNRDYPIVQGAVLVLSIIVMVINLVVDVTYKWIDPRVEIE